jgi:geranylgeranyl reductase family protein
MRATVYDAVVVGAGPAGSIAALNLARRGARVLLLERQPLGREKPCGGGLTPRAWKGLEVAFGDLVMSRLDSTELHHAGRLTVRVSLGDRPVWMVRRRDFDERIVSEAMRAGAELHDRESVASVEPDARGVTVRSSKGTYRGGALLLATGAEGSLHAALGLLPPRGVMAVGLELEAPARADHLDPRRLIFDFGTPGGYAWAFPKGDYWNVGVLSSSRQVAPQLRSRLAAFIAQLGVRFDLPGEAARHARGHRIPFHTPRARLTTRRAALIGDAARLADPLYGEGIAQALISGRLAAAAVAGLLSGERPDLRSYQIALERATGAHLCRMRWIARGVYAQPALAVRVLMLPPGRALARRISTARFATTTSP